MVLDFVTRDMLQSLQCVEVCPVGDAPRSRSEVDVILCCVCAQRPVRSKNRCRACGEYLRRNGYDRSVEQTERQRSKDSQRISDTRVRLVTAGSH